MWPLLFSLSPPLHMHAHFTTHPRMCALEYKIQNCRSLASDVRCVGLNSIDIFREYSAFILQELGSFRKVFVYHKTGKACMYLQLQAIWLPVLEFRMVVHEIHILLLLTYMFSYLAVKWIIILNCVSKCDIPICKILGVINYRTVILIFQLFACIHSCSWDLQ